MSEAEHTQAVADHHMRVELVSSRHNRVLIVVAGLDRDELDAITGAGGQSPMFTLRGNEVLAKAIRHFFEAEKPTAVYCHGTAALVDLRLSDGSYLVDGRTVTGFADAEEEFS